VSEVVPHQFDDLRIVINDENRGDGRPPNVVVALGLRSHRTATTFEQE